MPGVFDEKSFYSDSRIFILSKVEGLDSLARLSCCPPIIVPTTEAGFSVLLFLFKPDKEIGPFDRRL